MSLNKYVPIFCLLLHLASTTSGREIGNFYQDLTEIIDKCLQGDVSSKLELEKALTKSTFVYYSTDLLLNNITQIAPVLTILNVAKPRAAKYYLMLALRYTQRNHFMWQRLDDVYYNLALKFPPELQKQLNKHLTSVVLDWSVDSCDDSSAFLTRKIQHHGFGFNASPILVSAENTPYSFPYSMPKYVQNFLNLYLCEQPSNCTTVPVGVAYQFAQTSCGDYLHAQIQDADFLVISLNFPTSVHFPFSFKMFKEYISSFEKHNELFLESKWKGGLVYRININEPPTPSQLKDTWKAEWSDLETLLSTSKYYNVAVTNLISKTFRKSLTFLEAFLFLYLLDVPKERSDMSPAGNKFSMVMGNKLTKVYVTLEKEEEPIIDPGVVMIPHLFTNEVESTACSLRKDLGTSGSGKIVVDLSTWRAVTRHKEMITDPKLNCTTKLTLKKPTNANLVLDENTILFWDTLEKHVNFLIHDTRNVKVATLQTVTIPENALYEKTIAFIFNLPENYSMGCKVDFDKEKLEVLKVKAVFAEELKFKTAMEGLCGEIFGNVDEFLWNVDEVSSVAGRELMVVAKDVFMKEFPDKTVTLQISSTEKMTNIDDYVSSWAVFYEMPVAF